MSVMSDDAKESEREWSSETREYASRTARKAAMDGGGVFGSIMAARPSAFMSNAPHPKS